MTVPVKQLKDEENQDFYPQTVKAAIADYDAPKITMTDTDPGEGVPLNEDHYIAVFGNVPKVQTDDIADEAVTSDKIDWTTLEKRVLLKTFSWDELGLGFNNKNIIDIRTLFAGPNSVSRIAYFDEILFDFSLLLTSINTPAYLRFGNLEVSNATYRSMLTFSGSNSITLSREDQSTLPFSTQNFFKDTISIKPGINAANLEVDSGSWDNFVFTTKFYGQLGEQRIHLGSFVRTQHSDKKLFMWFDTENPPRAGYLKIYGIKYSK